MYSDFFARIFLAGISQRKSNRGRLGWLFCSSDNYYKIIENAKRFLRKCRGCKNALKFCDDAKLMDLPMDQPIFIEFIKYQCQARDERVKNTLGYFITIGRKMLQQCWQGYVFQNFHNNDLGWYVVKQK
jgi:hypothetical protein